MRMSCECNPSICSNRRRVSLGFPVFMTPVWHRSGVIVKPRQGVGEKNLRAGSFSSCPAVSYSRSNRLQEQTVNTSVGRTKMQLHPIQLADSLSKVNYLTARTIRGGEYERVCCNALRAYEADCTVDIWLERCAARIGERIA